MTLAFTPKYSTSCKTLLHLHSKIAGGPGSNYHSGDQWSDIEYKYNSNPHLAPHTGSLVRVWFFDVWRFEHFEYFKILCYDKAKKKSCKYKELVR